MHETCTAKLLAICAIGLGLLAFSPNGKSAEYAVFAYPLPATGYQLPATGYQLEWRA